MSAGDDEPLVELVAVDGTAVQSAREHGHGDDRGEFVEHGARPTSRRTRLLALGALAVVGAGLGTAAVVHNGPKASHAGPGVVVAPAATLPGTDTSDGRVGALSTAVPPGTGELLAEQQAAQQLAQQAVIAQMNALTHLRAMRPANMSCPGIATTCRVEFEPLPAAVFAAITSHLPDAVPIHKYDATGFDAGDEMYFRQLQLRVHGCVITLQLLRERGRPDDHSSDVALYSGDAPGHLSGGQHEAARGFVGRFALTGAFASCPGDGVLNAIISDPRLLAATR